MGGNLIKSYDIETKRLSPTEYKAFCDEVFYILTQAITNVTSPLIEIGSHCIRVPHHIRNKESFGDLDILIQLIDVSKKNQFIEIIKQKFNPQFWHNNGPVSSFGYKNFQIDLIFSENIDFHNQYLSWGDGGNLIGMFANRNGMKLSQDGLYYQIRLNETELLDEVLLSRDWYEVLEFFDLSQRKWEDGFNSSEELYQFLASSSYFQPEWFNPDDFNHEKRDREKKRPVFANFREWIVENKIQSGENFNVLWCIDNCFKIDLKPKIDRLIKDALNQKRIKKLFSERLAELNLTNKEKSVKIPQFKNAWNWPQNFLNWDDEKIANFLKSNFN